MDSGRKDTYSVGGSRSKHCRLAAKIIGAIGVGLTISGLATAQVAPLPPELGQGEYARGVPYPDFGWDPLNHNAEPTQVTSSLPSVISDGEVVLYTGTDGGTIRFDCDATAPCILKGDGQTLDSSLRTSGSHYIVDGFSFFNITSSVQVGGSGSPASFAAIRNIEHGGDNSGSSNGTSMSITFAENIVYFRNHIHNLRDDSGESEVDYIGFVPRHEVDQVWYLDNHVYRLGGDAMRTGTNVSRLDSGLSPPTNIYVAKNRFHDMGENPIDLKYSTDIVISENELYGAVVSVSSGGTGVALHESADRVSFYDNHIHSVRRGIVTATAGGGAEYILVDGNLFEDISDIGVYNRGGGHADVFDNTFRNVEEPINNNDGNGSTITQSGNTFE